MLIATLSRKKERNFFLERMRITTKAKRENSFSLFHLAQIEANLSPFGQAVAGIEEFDFEVDGPGGSEFDIIDVTRATASARLNLGGIGVSLGATFGDAEECDGGCEISFGGGNIVFSIGDGSVELFEIFEFNLPTFEREINLWDPGTRPCG